MKHSRKTLLRAALAGALAATLATGSAAAGPSRTSR